MPKKELPQDNSENENKPKSRFVEMLEAQWKKGNFVCVGLDLDLPKIPKVVHQRTSSIEDELVDYGIEMVEATEDLVCAYKPNSAFYEAFGEDGFIALRKTIRHIRVHYPDVPVILDAKRADIGNTNKFYAEMAFTALGADAITVHPYLGKEAMHPFLDYKDKGIFVLTKTSNPGADEFQDLYASFRTDSPSARLYEYVAERVSKHWNENGNVGVVVGATYPHHLEKIRRIVGDMPILIPGVGAQGGDLEATVKAGMDSRGWGMIINSSRGIIFASDGPDFAEAARRETEKLRNQINEVRQAA